MCTVYEPVWAMRGVGPRCDLRIVASRGAVSQADDRKWTLNAIVRLREIDALLTLLLLDTDALITRFIIDFSLYSCEPERSFARTRQRTVTYC